MAIAGVTAVAVVIAAAVTIVLVNRHSTTTTGATHSPGSTTSQSGITNENQLLQAIATQGWNPQRVEELFALDVGPLPGVSVKGIAPLGVFDVSTAVTGLYGQWDHLTAAQRAAATRYLSGVQTQSHYSAPPPHGADAVLLGPFSYQFVLQK